MMSMHSHLEWGNAEQLVPLTQVMWYFLLGIKIIGVLAVVHGGSNQYTGSSSPYTVDGDEHVPLGEGCHR